MSTALELVYEYRHLMGKCWAGAGLSMDEIEAVEAIEGLFSGSASPFAGSSAGLADRLSATLRGGPRQMVDDVELVAAHLDRLEVRTPAFLELGALIEVLVEDQELRLSYRFKSSVREIADAEAGTARRVVLELHGVPLLVRRGPKPFRPGGNPNTRLASEPRVAAA